MSLFFSPSEEQAAVMRDIDDTFRAWVRRNLLWTLIFPKYDHVLPPPVWNIVMSYEVQEISQAQCQAFIKERRSMFSYGSNNSVFWCYSGGRCLEGLVYWPQIIFALKHLKDNIIHREMFTEILRNANVNGDPLGFVLSILGNNGYDVFSPPSTPAMGSVDVL
jgi:hypothetical protein